MVFLYVFRHAKAENRSGGSDLDRRLTKRGRREAGTMGVLAREMGWVPDVALISPAVRTSESWELFSAQMPGDIPWRAEHEIYHDGSSGYFLKLLNSLEPDMKSAILVGHNPGISDLAQRLVASERSVGLDGRAHVLPGFFSPGGLCGVKFAVSDWSALAFGGGKLEGYVQPHEIRR